MIQNFENTKFPNKFWIEILEFKISKISLLREQNFKISKFLCSRNPKFPKKFWKNPKFQKFKIFKILQHRPVWLETFPEAPGGQGQGARPALQTLCSFSRAWKAQFHGIFRPPELLFPRRQEARARSRGPGLRYKPYVRFREP